MERRRVRPRQFRNWNNTFQGSILAKLAGSEQIGASQNGTDPLPSREVAIFRKLYVRGSLDAEVAREPASDLCSHNTGGRGIYSAD